MLSSAEGMAKRPSTWQTNQALPQGPRHRRRFLVRVDGHQLNAKLLDLLDEPEQVRLIGHLAGQHRRARKALQLHAFKQEPERTAQFPAKDEPVPAGMCAICCSLLCSLTPRQVTRHPLLARFT